MKPQTSILLLCFSIMLAITSCENDIEKIRILSTEGDMPNLTAKGIEVIYSDSSKVRVQLNAPEIKQYTNVEEPYAIFPQGIKVVFFDDSLNVESEITANYAIYYTEDKLWHAEGNVVVQNRKSGERLDSEELFWNEEEREIYNDSYTRIEKTDGIFYGNEGFRSNEDFTKYTLKGSSGVVNLEEDE